MERIPQLIFLLLFVSIEGSERYFCRFVSHSGTITNIDKQVLSSRDIFVCALTCMESENCQLFSFFVQQNLCTLHSKQRFPFAETVDGWRTWVIPSEELDEQDTSTESMSNSVEASLQYSANITLHQACGDGKLDMVKYILAKGLIDINSRGKLNMTSVMAAARYGHLDVFNFLVSKDCDLSLLNDYKDNVFHSACVGGNTEIVIKLLTGGIFDTDVKGWRGKTGLILAVEYGNREVVDLLESKGCNMQAVDKYGNNVLHYACLSGHVDMVKYILSKRIVSINSRGHGRKTPVMMAIERGHMKVVLLLVHQGCSLTALTKNKWNILHLACLFGRVEMTRYFLSHCKISIESKGPYGNSPVMLAAGKGQIQVVKFLVHKGCVLTRVNDNSDTILHLAASSGNVDLVEYILSRKVVDINTKGFRGCTAVMKAAEYGHKGVVELLVRRGCNLSIVGNKQNTVLHSACIGGDVDTVKYILKLTVMFLKVKNKYGRTPLQVAKFNGHESIVDLLTARE